VTGYDFHPAALEDLNEIWEYIRLDSLDVADWIVADILAGIRSLVALPSIGHVRPDLTSRPLRFITVREYLIAYAPRERPLWVIAVIHGRRNPRIIAAILRDRE
jgi:plasmid stabilization system protein ParE